MTATRRAAAYEVGTARVAGSRLDLPAVRWPSGRVDVQDLDGVWLTIDRPEPEFTPV